MAKISIKTDFADGDKLFAQQLNLNFKTIEAAFDSSNKIVWDDTTEEGTEVKFKRYITTDIDSLPIEDGAVIYDVTKGRHYIDYLGERIQVGSAGNEIVISETEPTHEDTKLWINPKEIVHGDFSEGTSSISVLNSYSESTSNPYSANFVNQRDKEYAEKLEGISLLDIEKLLEKQNEGQGDV